MRSVFARRRSAVTSRDEKARLFAQVYRRNFWGNEESRSGSGSDLAQTAELRAQLPALLAEFGVRTMLDIPCGDFFWMNACQLDLERYIGADIVPELVQRLTVAHATAGREFRVLDLTSDDLPQVDLIFCRDALVHFSNADILGAIANMKRSGARYLLTTIFVARAENPDIPTGGNWRPLNLQAPPFSLPPPLRLIDERCTEFDGRFADKSMGLWRISDL
jgi:methyltransferase family protein